MKYDNCLELLRKYVREDQPFGPPDAVDVEEPICAAALYDWNNRAFAEMLTGSDVFVGRRGSGKSSLLKSFPVRKFLAEDFKSAEGLAFRKKYHVPPKVFTNTPMIVVQIATPNEVSAIEDDIDKAGRVPPVELLSEQWRKRMWLQVLRKLEQADGALWDDMPDDLKAYAANDDLGEPNALRLSAEVAIRRVEEYLRAKSVRIVATFDNLEENSFTPKRNAVLGGLIAATGKFIGAQHPSVDVKLCLPAELFREIKKFAFRPDKDLHRVQYLHWNAKELLQLAAKRLRVYMAANDIEQFELNCNIDLSSREDLVNFWHLYFPERIKNGDGGEEDTITYILRHTQMLPRQFISVLNAICRRYRGEGDRIFYRRFSDREIRKGVEDSEIPSKDAILFMYQNRYPELEDMLSVSLPRLSREFDYGYLQSIWQSSAKTYMERMGMDDFLSFWRLLISIGVIGVRSDSESTAIYSLARFEYNTKYPMTISDKDVLCVHPLFSRTYNLVKKSGTRTILPRGSDFRVDYEETDGGRIE
jgi:hypothetical protein